MSTEQSKLHVAHCLPGFAARHRRYGGGSGHGRRPLDDPWHPARSIRSHPPPRQTVEFAGVNIFRLASGKIVEIWNHRDDLRLYQQLGVRSSPPQSPS